MSKRTVVIGDEQLPEQNEFLRTEVYYSEGGANYFSGSSNARGYYVSVKPIKIESGCVSFMLFSGCKKLVLESKRFSAKTLEAVAQKMATSHESVAVIEPMKFSVLAERETIQARNAARRAETVPA